MNRRRLPRAENPDASLTGEPKARYVQQMFGRIAQSYDLMNTLMSFGQDSTWRRETARAALPRVGAAIALDVGTGTGLIARELAARGATAIALDVTVHMMLVGLARGVDRGGRLHFVVGDALKLPFRERTFDAVTTGFMLRNVVDIDAALREMRRVLKPGGRLVCLEVGRPQTVAARAGHAVHTKKVVPLLGRLVAGDADAYRYLPSSMARFPAPPDLAHRFEEAGLRHVRYRQYTMGAAAIHRGMR